MFTRELILDLFRYMEWADARVWGAIGAADPGDDRLRSLLVHLHAVQRGFLAVWTGTPVQEAFPPAESFPTLSAVRAWARPLYAEQQAFLSTKADADLGRVVIPPWIALVETHIGRPPGPTSLGETAFQVVSHTTYHRGQINTRLRELGLTPPHVDYLVWLWLDRPAADWSG